jgi:DNA-binding MarR family transcriptional regulator
MDHVDRITTQWQAERPDLDVAPLALLGRLLRVAELAERELAAGLAESDLQSGWFDLLAALRRNGPRYELNPTQLMRATLLSSGGITKRLDRLAEAGLVERRPDPNDRRGTLVKLTRKGRTTIDRLIAVHIANEQRLLQVLKPTERRALDAALRRLLATLEPDGDA